MSECMIFYGPTVPEINYSILFYSIRRRRRRFFLLQFSLPSYVGLGSVGGDRGWLSHGLVVTLAIYYSLDGGTLWGFTCDMRITD